MGAGQILRFRQSCFPGEKRPGVRWTFHNRTVESAAKADGRSDFEPVLALARIYTIAVGVRKCFPDRRLAVASCRPA